MEVKLIDYMGSDLRVVNAARVSFNKESTLVDSDVESLESPAWYDMTGEKLYVQVLQEQDQKLIKYLAKHNHWTPFSHVMITMREKVPIFVARQRFKHMVGFTYNEVSRRYVDDTPDFYIPDVWRSRPDGSVKQGSGGNHPDSEQWSIDYGEFLRDAESLYTEMLRSGIAPEQARMVLPQSTYTEYYTTGSLAAWARAYKLRVDSHAQREIQDLAKMWNNVISNIQELKYSWQALTT